MSTCEEVVIRIAKARGFEIDNREAAYILWEHTGFPAFWPDSKRTPACNLRRQVREYFSLRRKGLQKCWQCGYPSLVEELEGGACKENCLEEAA